MGFSNGDGGHGKRKAAIDSHHACAFDTSTLHRGAPREQGHHRTRDGDLDLTPLLLKGADLKGSMPFFPRRGNQVLIGPKHG